MVNMTFTQHADSNDTIEVEAKKFNETIVMKFSVEQLKIALRYMTEI